MIEEAEMRIQQPFLFFKFPPLQKLLFLLTWCGKPHFDPGKVFWMTPKSLPRMKFQSTNARRRTDGM